VETALILAGGQSRRFGRPKSLIDIGGVPMIRRVAEVMLTMAEETLVSVADVRTETALRSVMPDAAFVIDRRGGQGPIEGFRSGFEVARGDRVLVAPCDAPLLRPALYRLLLDSIGKRDAAVPRFDVIDPVRAVYRRKAVLNVLAGGTDVPSPSALVDSLDAVFVDPPRLRLADPDLSSFLDVNSQKDLEDVLGRISAARD